VTGVQTCALPISAGGELTVTWDMKRATQAGLTGKDNWKKYPAQMLSARVVAEGVRAVFPACLSGMYTSEEVQDMPELKPMRTVTPEPQAITHTEPLKSDSAVAALYQSFRDYINSGLLNEEAEKALQAAMDSGDTRIKHLEKMLARAKQIHDEAMTGRAEE